MSLIHQALKKAEGARGDAASREYAFQRSAMKALRRYAIPVVFVITTISGFFLLVPAKKTQMRQTAAAAVNAPIAPASTVKAKPDYNARGIAEYTAGRYDDAAASFKTALDSQPRSASLHSNMGVALMRLGKKDEAEAAFKKAIELDPGHVEALNDYACLLAESGRTKKAVELLENAIRTNPSYADARLNLAILLEKKGDLQGAFDNYSKFMGLNGTGGEVPAVKKKVMMLRSELILKHSGAR